MNGKYKLHSIQEVKDFLGNRTLCELNWKKIHDVLDVFGYIRAIEVMDMIYELKYISINHMTDAINHAANVKKKEMEAENP